MSVATVYLVGAGPGDPGLVTVRGLDLLRRADAVIYDYLAPAELLDEVPPAAERIYVGKKGFSAHVTQDEINVLLVESARRMCIVLPLLPAGTFGTNPTTGAPLTFAQTSMALPLMATGMLLPFLFFFVFAGPQAISNRNK